MDIPIQELQQCLIAMALGAVLGIEREMHTKPAGLRTIMFVCLGSCLFTLMSLAIAGPGQQDRIAANIVTGIGFLGAGAIFRDENRISGLTTAAMIWYAAAIGMMVGKGYESFAMLMTGIAIAIIWIIYPLEVELENRYLNREYSVGVREGTFDDLDYFKNIFTQSGLKYQLLGVNLDKDKLITRWRITGSKKKHTALIQSLLADQRVFRLDY